METPYGGTGFRPDAAFTNAAERFFELLKAFGMTAAVGPGRAPDWSGLAGPLAGQFEQWLRMSQSAGPWFGNPTAAMSGAAPAAGAAFASQPWSFGPLPLGPAAAQPNEAGRTFELFGRLTQLQAQLATHWNEVASAAARGFVERLGSADGAAAAGNALKLYELWVNCAEEAYAVRVHREDFCRLQGELANTSAALLVEQRRHAETLVRAFGLPTRNEMDALYGQLKELRGQLAQIAEALRAAPAADHAPPAGAGRRPARGAQRKRPRKRRPRA